VRKPYDFLIVTLALLSKPSTTPLESSFCLASLSIGDYTSQCTPSGRLEGMQSRPR
jgi:hypothetical protein